MNKGWGQNKNQSTFEFEGEGKIPNGNFEFMDSWGGQCNQKM